MVPNERRKSSWTQLSCIAVISWHSDLARDRMGHFDMETSCVCERFRDTPFLKYLPLPSSRAVCVSLRKRSLMELLASPTQRNSSAAIGVDKNPHNAGVDSALLVAGLRAERTPRVPHPVLGRPQSVRTSSLIFSARRLWISSGPWRPACHRCCWSTCFQQDT
jgi:hypothetical protein